MVLTFAVFAPGLGTGTFVNGPDSILRISLLSHPRHIPTIFTQDFMIFTEGQYRPLSYALLSAVRPVAGADHTWFWHLWLVGFHALNVVLVFGVVRFFARRPFAAFVAAAVFAVHPLGSLFGNGMDRFHYVLAGSFYLGVLLCYLHFARGGRRGFYVTGLVLFLSGLLTSKVLLTLPVFLLLYEVLYARPGARRAVRRVLPFVLIALVLSPCWLLLRPHPLFYVYPPFPGGSGWFSLYTFVARTGVYLRGLAAGSGFERPLTEVVERVMTPYHAGFLLWSLVILGGVVFTVYELVRRRWVGLGVLLAGVSVLPYVSTVFHNTRDFISWDYLYLSVAGLAVVAGAAAEAGLGVRRRFLRAGVVVVAIALLGWWGVTLVGANLRTRSARTYWQHVLERNPDSETASIQLGRACLEEGDYETALTCLFAPRVKSIHESGLIMSEYYCHENELLAAVVHHNLASDPNITDMHVLNRIEMVRAEIVSAAGALDYAEQALTVLLMTDPWDTRALKMLADILARKGYVNAALKYLEEARRLDPYDPALPGQLERTRRRKYSADAFPPEHITPPDPEWLRYLMSRRAVGNVRDDVIRLSYRLTHDPVLQAEAGMCLLSVGQPERAREKFDMAVRYMPDHPYVRAGKLSADVQSGVLTQDDTSGDVGPAKDAAMWNDMGYLLFQQGKLGEAVSCFRTALRIDPNSARAHTNLALVLTVQEEHQEAVEHYRRAIALAPKDPEPYRSLASAQMSRKDFAGCIDTLSSAVEAVPEDRELRLRLAWALTVAADDRLRDGVRAVTLAESALEPPADRTPRTLNILAAAYAEAGRFDRAVATVREALELARSQNDQTFIRTSEERLRLYEQRRPYRPGVSP